MKGLAHTFIENMKIIYTVHKKVGDIGTHNNLEIKLLICRVNNFVFS